MQAGSDRADFDAQEFRDVFVFHFLIAKENEQLAIGFRELSEGALEQRLLLVFLEVAARGEIRCHDVHAMSICSFRRVFPKVIDPGVPRDLIHPRHEPIGFAIGRPILQNSNEHFLHEIVADLTVSRKTAEKVEEWFAIPREENLELVDISFAHGDHKVFITPMHGHHG